MDYFYLCRLCDDVVLSIGHSLRLKRQDGWRVSSADPHIMQACVIPRILKDVRTGSQNKAGCSPAVKEDGRAKMLLTRYNQASM